MTPSDVCSAIKFCDAAAHALPWSVIGGPGPHVWGRHVDCTRRVRVQVPRPTGRPKQCQARLKGRTRQAPQNGSSLARGRPLPRRYVTLTKAVAGQTPVGAAPSPRVSFVCTDSGNRRPVMKQRCGIIEQPQIGELPIEGPIARVAIKAHRHRLTVIPRLHLTPGASFPDGSQRPAASSSSLCHRGSALYCL